MTDDRPRGPRALRVTRSCPTRSCRPKCTSWSLGLLGSLQYASRVSSSSSARSRRRTDPAHDRRGRLGSGIDRARHPGGRQEHVRSGGARSRRPDPRHRRSARPAERSCRRWHRGLRGRRGRRGRDLSDRSPARRARRRGDHRPGRPPASACCSKRSSLPSPSWSCVPTTAPQGEPEWSPMASATSSRRGRSMSSTQPDQYR